MKTSAGLLMYRIRNGAPEVFLVHPGGPFWKKRDDGAWSIPKGEVDNYEAGDGLLEVAKREFEEETGIKPNGEFKYLTSVRRKDGKVVEVWMFEGDCDPASIKSNTIFIEWPPRSEKQLEIPEVDRAGFFTIDEAKKKLNKYQIGIIEAFERVMIKLTYG
ncbi:MAG: NUDIX domain-containing protein [Candidatus Colwellbacteria bacterium]|nr:NUDIX domain-containing protein [Candidatus Colwellbacteria bacterium]